MVPTFLFASAALLSAGAVSAQVSSFSDNCNNALTGLAANSEASSCLSISSLISLFLNGEDSSIIDPVDNWLESFCAAPLCSNSTLSTVVDQITSGCSAELSVLGYSSDVDITSAVQQAFPTVKRVLCLDDSGTNCITQTLTNAQTALNTTLSINNIVALAAGSASSSDTTLPSTVTCSNCVKAAYNIINEDFPALVSSDIAGDQCSADFVDGQAPSGITETASTNTQAESQSNTDAALSIYAHAMLAMGASVGAVVTGMVYFA